LTSLASRFATSVNGTSMNGQDLEQRFMALEQRFTAKEAELAARLTKVKQLDAALRDLRARTLLRRPRLDEVLGRLRKRLAGAVAPGRSR
jgi:hypothetical protein